jgi:hypothetical protein
MAAREPAALEGEEEVDAHESRDMRRNKSSPRVWRHVVAQELTSDGGRFVESAPRFEHMWRYGSLSWVWGRMVVWEPTVQESGVPLQRADRDLIKCIIL